MLAGLQSLMRMFLSENRIHTNTGSVEWVVDALILQSSRRMFPPLKVESIQMLMESLSDFKFCCRDGDVPFSKFCLLTMGASIDARNDHLEVKYAKRPVQHALVYGMKPERLEELSTDELMEAFDFAVDYRIPATFCVRKVLIARASAKLDPKLVKWSMKDPHKKPVYDASLAAPFDIDVITRLPMDFIKSMKERRYAFPLYAAKLAEAGNPLDEESVKKEIVSDCMDILFDRDHYQLEKLLIVLANSPASCTRDIARDVLVKLRRNVAKKGWRPLKVSADETARD